MKKSTKITAVIIAILCVAALIIKNRNDSKSREGNTRAKQLAVTIKGEEKSFKYLEEGEDYITFDTQMKHKNGDVFDKNYSGREISAILADCGAELAEGDKVTITCRDNYRIELSAEEILRPGNVYLVTRESGERLAEEDGVFMLVVNNDEFSTRWAKNVVSIEVK